MSKIKNTTATAELYAGADMLKSSFGKTAKILGTTAEFSKGNVDLYANR